MMKLLIACCRRWLRYPFARLCLVLMTAGGILLALFGADVNGFRTASVDDALLGLAGFCQVLITVPVITALTQQELTDGVIRNKLTRGYSRGTVYLSQMLTAFLFSVICSLLLYAPLFLRAFDLLDRTMCAETAGMLVVFTLFLPALSAVCTAVCMNAESFAGIAVCIGLLIGLFAAGIGVQDRLRSPKMTAGDPVMTDGAVQETQVPNPRFVDGTARKLLQTVSRSNPFGARISAQNYADLLPFLAEPGIMQDPERMEYAERTRGELSGAPYCLIGFTVLVSGIGYAVFRRRDLR